MASSVYNAERAVIQCARDHSDDHPLAAKTIEKCFYVDDGLMGAATVKDTIELAENVKSILSKGGFELSKWGSNSSELLRKVAENDINNKIELKEDNETRVLGLKWLTHSDEMTIAVKLEGMQEADTKQLMLSFIARMFDPNGFIAPIVIVAKVIIQELWRNDRITWKSKLPIYVF